MSRLIFALILTALASGCASSPEQGEQVTRFLNGMAAGAVIGGAMRPQPVYNYAPAAPVYTTCNRWGNRVQCWSQ